MTNEELKQLVETNARTAQAMLDSMAEARQERQELREGMRVLRTGVIGLENIVEGLTSLQEGFSAKN